MAITKVIKELTDLNQANSESGLKMPTGTAFSGTPEEGMMRNDTAQVSEASASTMQHYNGTDWKNFSNVPLPPPLLLAGGTASAGKSLRYSADNGTTWSDVASSGFSNDSVLARVGYNGSYYLAYNINGELSNSTDGINFTAVSGNGGLPATPQMNAKTLLWTGTRWVGVFAHNYPSQLGKIWTSTNSDGSSWSQTSPNDTCFFLDNYNDSIATWWVIPASSYPAYVSTTSGTPSWSSWGAKFAFGNQSSVGGFTTSEDDFVIGGGYSNVPAFTSNGFSSFSAATGVAQQFQRAFFKTDTTFFIQNENLGNLYKSTNGNSYSFVGSIGASVNLGGGYVYNGTDLFVGTTAGSIYRTNDEFSTSTVLTPGLGGAVSLTASKIYDHFPNIT